MNLRLAKKNDLSQLKRMYEKIIDSMNENNIQIWDEIYPKELRVPFCMNMDLKLK
jgi:hypothetical protein